jgi:hypothetical protein
MGKVTPITEHFQRFVQDLKESFWGDLQAAENSAEVFPFAERAATGSVHGESALTVETGSARIIAMGITRAIL